MMESTQIALKLTPKYSSYYLRYLQVGPGDDCLYNLASVSSDAASDFQFNNYLLTFYYSYSTISVFSAGSETYNQD